MILAEMHRNIKVRIGVGFVQRFLDIMLVPLMVIYFTRLYGPVTAGLLTVVVACASIAATVVGGHLADVYGRRPTLLIGEVGSCVAFAGMVLANSPWWQSGVATYCCYLINSVLVSVVRPASDAAIIDVSDPEDRTTIYAINYWSINVAFVFGALVGGFLYGGYFTYLLTGGLLASCGVAVVTWLMITESKPEAPPKASERHWLAAVLGGYVTVLRDGVFARLILAILFVSIVSVQISYYVGVRLAEHFPKQRLLDIGSWTLIVDGVSFLGILRAINTFLVVCLALVVGRLLRRMGDRHKLGIGTAIFTVGYMVLAVSTDPWLLIAATVGFTIGELMTAPTRQALLANIAPSDARSKYMAVYQMQFRLAIVVGSLCVTLGAVVPPIVMSVLYGLLGGTAMVLFRSVLRRKVERDAADSLARAAA